MTFPEVVRGLSAGDFSRLAPLFDVPPGRSTCQIISWYEAGLFAAEPTALAEAVTCAAFNGAVDVLDHLLARGANPSGGAGTGLNAIHWAANRGQLRAVECLLRYQAPLESVNAYGGTTLGCAVWSAVHEPLPDLVLRAVGSRAGSTHGPIVFQNSLAVNGRSPRRF